MTSLYIFVTSERPDQYLNSIAHCLMEEGIRRIVFLHVRGAAPSENQTNSGKGISLSVFRRVQILMEGLAEGEYRHSIGNKAGETQALARVYPPERIGEIAKLYKHCLGIDAKWLHQDVAYLVSMLTKIRTYLVKSVS